MGPITAQELKVGSEVLTDSVYTHGVRKGRAIIGVVKSVGDTIHTNIHNYPYVWVNLGEEGVWPSYRLEGVLAW